MSVFYGTWKQLYHLDTVGFCESDMGAHVWAHVLWFWNSMCVFPQEILPSYKTQDSCELSQHFSSPLDIVYILPDSSLNSAIPQVWLISFPSNGDGAEKNSPSSWPPKWTSQLGTYGWSQCICSGLLTQPWDPESWSKGVLASPFMPRGTRPPEVQIVSIIVRWAQWSWNPGQT